MERLRCPFCHDLLDTKAVDRVVCVGCNAGHHAECFAEHGSCAATACSSTSVGVGGAELDVASLREVATDREALARLAATPPSEKRSWLGSLVGGTIALLGFPIAGYLFGMPGLLVWMIVGTLLLAGLLSPSGKGRVRLNLREPQTYDAIWGVVRTGSWLPGTFPDQTEGVRERLAAGGRPATMALPERTPEACPSCEQALETEEEEDGPLAYCYHCGASLAEGPVPPPLEEDVAPRGPEPEKA